MAKGIKPRGGREKPNLFIRRETNALTQKPKPKPKPKGGKK